MCEGFSEPKAPYIALGLPRVDEKPCRGQHTLSQHQISWQSLHSVTLIRRQSIWKPPRHSQRSPPSLSQLSLLQNVVSHWPPIALCEEEMAVRPDAKSWPVRGHRPRSHSRLHISEHPQALTCFPGPKPLPFTLLFRADSRALAGPA